MRKRAPRDFNGRTEVRKDGSVAVKTDGRMESSPRIAERDGPSRLPYEPPLDPPLHRESTDSLIVRSFGTLQEREMEVELLEVNDNQWIYTD